MEQKVEIRPATPVEAAIVGEIADVYVAPEYRSAGIGKSLVDVAIDFGRRRGWPFPEVGAPAFPMWQRTVAFYDRFGFREIGPRLELRL